MNPAQASVNFPVFIVGLPRSGSTLWLKVISKHPDVAPFTEVHFLSLWHRDFRYILNHVVGDLSKKQNVAKLLDVMFSKKHIIRPKNTIWFWKQIRDLEEKGLRESLHERILASDDRGIGVLFRLLIEEATHCQGLNRAVVKFPVYPTYVGNLIKWWPEGRIVHISRDPRALAASKANDPGGVANIVKRYPWAEVFLPVMYRYFSVFQYILDSYVHSRFDGLQNYRLFLYEDLLTKPDKVIRELCVFCGLDFDESMLSPSAGQASSITGQKSGGFDPSRSEGWRKTLSPFESKLIRYVARSSMRRFGYTPRG